MDHWYFAYGSNMLAEQLVRRTHETVRTGEERPRRVRLAGYRLAFNLDGGDGQVYANIVPADGETFGVIYRCTEASLQILDGFERGYNRISLPVVDEEGREYSAVAYIARPECITDEALPSDAYLTRIVTGAREHGLPGEVIQAIQTFAGR
jgi:cation transport regulator ChaC